MSLLEDVFLEDEADEAQELERVIEGDEYEEINRAVSPNSDRNSEKEDEAEEDKRRVDPSQSKTKKVTKNPRFILNPARLTGPRGIQVIPEHFKDFKFKGKGHEKEDLDMILKKLEHWAYRLYPRFEFEDCLKKIETLGRKRPVMVHLHKIRNDQLETEVAVVQKDSSDEEETPAVEDEFDKLLQQQIELAQATPRPSSVQKHTYSTPRQELLTSIVPKATSSPSINVEQRERMLRNRRLAEERRLAKLRNDKYNEDLKNSTGFKLDVINEGSDINTSQNNPQNEYIDSNEPTTVEIHNGNAETNIAKEIQNDAHVTKENDHLKKNLNDKFEDIETVTSSSEGNVDNMDNECIKNQNLNDGIDSSKCHDESDEGGVEKELDKKIDNGAVENIQSTAKEQTERPVDEELMEVDFTEDF